MYYFYPHWLDLSTYINTSISCPSRKLPNSLKLCGSWLLRRSRSNQIYSDSDYTDFVVIQLELGSNDKLLIGNFYRSPNSSLESDEKLHSLFNLICNKFTCNKIFVGDFNFPTLIGLHYQVCLVAVSVISVINL